MKRRLFVVVLVTVLFLVGAGWAPGALAQTGTPASSEQAGTPVPSGQINAPGISIAIDLPGPNPVVNTPDARGRVAGIALGIWHGIVSPVSLIVSIFNPNVQMYDVHNDGGQYNFGFLVGVAIVFTILGAIGGSRRRR